MKIPVDSQRVELEEIKARQKARKGSGKPAKVTMEILYEMQMDILENQARQENWIKELKGKLGQ